MQLSYAFSTLLVSILCATSLVEARPAPATAGVITLPLRTVKVERDVHPHIALQQHANRAVKRHAQMTGREVPTERELHDNLVERALAIEASGEDSGISKRFYSSDWAKSKMAQLKSSGVKSNARVAAAKPKTLLVAAPAGILAVAGNGNDHGHVLQITRPAAAGVLQLGGGGNRAATVNANGNGRGRNRNGKGKKKAKVAAAAAAGGAVGVGAAAAADSASSAAAASASSASVASASSASEASASSASAASTDSAVDAATAAATTTSAAAAASGTPNAADGSLLEDSTADQTGAGFSKVALDAALSSGLTAANDPNADNTLGLDIEANDIGYIATIQMGTPPRDFKLLMDSGSADLWVGGENCVNQKDNGGCGNHTFLGTQSSSSFVDSGKDFEVTYGSGNVKGTIVTDDISVAGLALPKHTFGVATSESDDFANNNTPFDGLMGLAQSVLSQQNVPTPPEALATAGLIKDAIVSYKISRLADQKNDGAVTFGGLDNTLFDANTLVTFDNVNTQGFWEGDFTISVDGKDLGLAGRTAILDTGTSLILAPPADVTAFHDAIPGSRPDGNGGFIIPCTTSAKVSFTFAGQEFAIDPRDLVFVPVDQNDLTGDCVSAFTSGQIGGATEWLVGDVFLKNAYFSTDVTQNKISLAKLV